MLWTPCSAMLSSLTWTLEPILDSRHLLAWAPAYCKLFGGKGQARAHGASVSWCTGLYTHTNTACISSISIGSISISRRRRRRLLRPARTREVQFAGPQDRALAYFYLADTWKQSMLSHNRVQ